MIGDVAQLEDYRRRRSVRRVAAWLVAIAAVVGAVAGALEARDRLEWGIRKAAELLPDEEATA